MLEVSRYRAHAPRRLAFTAAHVTTNRIVRCRDFSKRWNRSLSSRPQSPL